MTDESRFQNEYNAEHVPDVSLPPGRRKRNPAHGGRAVHDGGFANLPPPKVEWKKRNASVPWCSQSSAYHFSQAWFLVGGYRPGMGSQVQGARHLMQEYLFIEGPCAGMELHIPDGLHRLEEDFVAPGLGRAVGASYEKIIMRFNRPNGGRTERYCYIASKAAAEEDIIEFLVRGYKLANTQVYEPARTTGL
jgi:hypothetical protein